MFEFKKKGEKTLLIKINSTRFDASFTGAFKDKINETVTDNLIRVEVDFSGVEFIDSSGIGALLSIQKKLSPNCEPMTLINANKSIVSVIELLRLHRVFRIQKQEN